VSVPRPIFTISLDNAFSMKGERGRAQLQVIEQVHRLLEHEGIPYWLFGGWAVDFHVGHMTRAHGDVDLAVWSSDAQRVTTLLKETGWTHAPEPDEDGGTGYARGDVRLELTFLVPRPKGSAAVSLRRGEVPFVQGPLLGELRDFDGVRCHVVSFETLVSTKSAQRDEPDDQAKDAADLVALRAARRTG
jgi:hypothetical protein